MYILYSTLSVSNADAPTLTLKQIKKFLKIWYPDKYFGSAKNGNIQKKTNFKQSCNLTSVEKSTQK